jgi:hypothetical protein
MPRLWYEGVTERNEHTRSTMKGRYTYKKQMSVKSKYPLSHSYKVSILIYELLPALQNLKDVSAVKSVPAPRNQLHTASWTASSVS